MDEARVALRMKRHLRPRDDDDFGMYTSDTLMDFWTNFSRGDLRHPDRRRLALAGRRRHRDHEHHADGRERAHARDRPAQGARGRRRDIVWQVLTESTTLSMIGGIIGTTLGFVLAMVIAAFSPLPARIEPWSVPLGMA